MRRYSLLIFLACLLAGATALLWLHEKNHAAAEAQLKVAVDAANVAHRIEQSLSAQEQVLRGLQALQALPTHVRAEDFSAYVNSLQLASDYPGLEGLGVIVLYSEAQLEQTLREQNATALKNYPLRPAGQRAWYAPVQQIEPVNEKNVALLGLDLYVDPMHRAALIGARDSGQLSVAGPTQNWEIADGKAGAACACFVMYLPFYDDASWHDSLESRREHIRGWMAARVRFAAILGDLAADQQAGASIEIYDGEKIGSATLMYAGGRPANQAANASALAYARLAGHTWTIRASAVSAPARGLDHASVLALLAFALSGAMVLLLGRALALRERALELAREMNRGLKESEARYQRLTEYDDLSGLPNRNILLDRLRHAIVQARRERTQIALLHLDLDRFKLINDSLGHHVGDMLLRAVAERICNCVRESDTASRTGADEFVILLAHAENVEAARCVAEKIRHGLSLPFEISGGHTLCISASIGVALYPHHGMDDVTLTRHAESAMYRAKEAGRDTVKVFVIEQQSVA